MDLSHQRVPPHVAHCISHRNGWSARPRLRCSSCPLDCSSQLGPTPHAHDTIQAIQLIHTTLSAALTRSRLCAAVHYGITSRSLTSTRNNTTTHERKGQELTTASEWMKHVSLHTSIAVLERLDITWTEQCRSIWCVPKRV
jgi:hypothetical protein